MDEAVFHINLSYKLTVVSTTIASIVCKATLICISVILIARLTWLVTGLGRTGNATDPSGQLAGPTLLHNSSASRLTRRHIGPEKRTAGQHATDVLLASGAVGPTTVSWLEHIFGWMVEALVALRVRPLVLQVSALCLSIAMGVATVWKTVVMLPIFAALMQPPLLKAAVGYLFVLAFLIGYLAGIHDERLDIRHLYPGLAKEIYLCILMAGAFVLDLVSDLVLKSKVDVLMPDVLNPLPEEAEQWPIWRHRERARG